VRRARPYRARVRERQVERGDGRADRIHGGTRW
jgi:hypothetical protein